MIEIEFLEDFATRKVGDVWKCDGQLAASLIRRGKAIVVDKSNGKAAQIDESPKPKTSSRKRKTKTDQSKS